MNNLIEHNQKQTILICDDKSGHRYENTRGRKNNQTNNLASSTNLKRIPFNSCLKVKEKNL